MFGYILNASKPHLVVKDKYDATARHAFSDMDTIFSTDEQRHLDIALGHKDYTTAYVTFKFQAWCDEVKLLAEIADIDLSSCCHAVFTYGLFGCWSCLMGTIPDVRDFLHPLKDIYYSSVLCFILA